MKQTGLMALKSVVLWGACVSQLAWEELCSKRSGISFNWRREFWGSCKWECFSVSGAQGKIMPVEDENPSSQQVDQMNNYKSKKLQKDFGSLPSNASLLSLAILSGDHRMQSIVEGPLSITDLSASPRDGSNVRIAYQGVPGAYSETAALKAYPQCEAVPCDQFEAAFKAVELSLVDKAVLPFENSSGGSIHCNYDFLFHHRLHIVGEVKLAINHCLLGLPGVRKEELKHVLSHPQALAQCEVTLSKLGVATESLDDDAGAAQFISSNSLRDTGAVASAQAAEIYGLNILAERIQDDPNNITRFLILAREPIIPRTDRPFKTSIVFTLEEGPGALFKALAVFALRDINLSKIESRPQIKHHRRVDDSNGSAKCFDYLFYIDFEASMAEHRAQNVLGHLQEFAKFLRVLGCYPVDMTI